MAHGAAEAHVTEQLLLGGVARLVPVEGDPLAGRLGAHVGLQEGLQAAGVDGLLGLGQVVGVAHGDRIDLAGQEGSERSVSVGDDAHGHVVQVGQFLATAILVPVAPVVVLLEHGALAGAVALEHPGAGPTIWLGGVARVHIFLMASAPPSR